MESEDDTERENDEQKRKQKRSNKRKQKTKKNITGKRNPEVRRTLRLKKYIKSRRAKRRTEIQKERELRSHEDRGINLEEYNAQFQLNGLNIPFFHVNKCKDEDATKHKKLFEKLDEQYKKLGDKKNWQFIEIFMYKEENKYHLKIASPYHDLPPNNQAIYTGKSHLPYDEELFKLINYHATKIIRQAPLCEYIKELLDRNNIVRISMDYYKGRKLSQAGFHRDTREYDGFYTSLTFNIREDQSVNGPELTHYNIYCESRGTEKSRDMVRRVFRPTIFGPYGTIGFNEALMLHSTPYSNDIENETLVFAEPVAFSLYPGYEELTRLRAIPLEQRSEEISEFLTNPLRVRTSETVRLTPSEKRLSYTPAEDEERPPFIRCWFEKFSNPSIIVYWLHADNDILFYEKETIEYTEDEFVKRFSADESIQNATEPLNIRVPNYEKFDPLTLNKAFNYVCRNYPNRGGQHV